MNVTGKNDFRYRFAFLGGGNMAYALTGSFVSSGLVKSEEIIVYDIDKSKYGNFTALGFAVAETAEEAVRFAEYVVIASKPSNVEESLTGISKEEGLCDGKTFISIAAGITIDFICKCLKRELPVIRTMPSTPMLIGQGAVAVCRNNLVDEKCFGYICEILSTSACVAIVTEDKMNSITAVNGSSPAYVYLFIKAMVESGEKLGIDCDTSLPLILKTIEGSVGMIRESGLPIEKLISNVASPKGTTLAALDSFAADNFVEIVNRAMVACAQRAEEITKELCGSK